MTARRNEVRTMPMHAVRTLATLVIGCGLLLGAQPAAAKWPYTLPLGPGIADRPDAIAFDAGGNAYVAGSFSGSGVKIGGMTYNSTGQQDIVVAKLDGDGNLLWLRVAGSAGADTVSGLALDGSGNVYIAGAFCRGLNPPPANCSASFGEVGTVTVPGTVANAYVAKLTTAGTFEWVRELSLAGAGTLDLNAATVAAGGVFVVGSLAGSVSSTTGGGISASSRATRTDAFFAKLSTAGDWVLSPANTWPLPGAAHAGTDFYGRSIVIQGARAAVLAQPFREAPTLVAAAIEKGPVYSIPGGGSCSVTGKASVNMATVTCGGIDLDGHAAVYFGVKNTATANGVTMNGAAPSGAAVFRLADGSSSTAIAYTSSTTVTDQRNGVTSAVENLLTLQRASGTLQTVAAGAGAPNNANGDVARLFQVGSNSFSIDVKMQSRTVAVAPFGFLPTDTTYDRVNTPEGQRDISSLDLAFYYIDKSRLVVLTSADLGLYTVEGIDLGFPATRLAGDAGDGLAAIGPLLSGQSITYGGTEVPGPGLAVARFDLGQAAGPFTGRWAARIEDDGGRFIGPQVVFGPGQLLTVASSYAGDARFLPETIGGLQAVLDTGSDEEILVAAIDDLTGEWRWANRAGGGQLDFPTGIAVDGSIPEGGLGVVGSYLAPAKFGTFFEPCSSTCKVIENNMQVDKPCDPLNAEAVCQAQICRLPLPCVGGGVPPIRTGFAMTLTDLGDWTLPVDRWVVGQEVPRPSGLSVIRKPSIEIDGKTDQDAETYFFWAANDQKLFAVKDTGGLPAKVKWQKTSDPVTGGFITVDGVVRLPDNPQIHIASAPVDLELSDVKRCGPASPRPFAACSRDQDCGAGQTCAKLPEQSRWSYFQLLRLGKAGDSDAAVDASTKAFTATKGWATLILANGPPGSNPSSVPAAVVVVRTVDGAKSASGQPAACSIGSAITDPLHVDPNGKNGWVVNPKSFFDGAGATAAYQRDVTRGGPILPVNRDRDDTAADDMLIAWYAQDARGIAWPNRAVHYDCQWPAAPDTVIIASGLGSDGRCSDVRAACRNDGECKDDQGAVTGHCIVQPPITDAGFPQAVVYAQDDPELPGFNPNEEHALLQPSNGGTGAKALFALRTDLNASLHLSDPYVLLKYRDPQSQQWAMRVYGVKIVDGIYTDTYDRVAGQHLEPPYPVNIMPACLESCAPTVADCTQPPMGMPTGAPSCQTVTDPITQQTAKRCVGGSLDGDPCTADANCVSACLQNGYQDPICSAGAAKNLALFKDHLGLGADGTWKGWWARAAGTIRARYDYPVQQGFFTDYDRDGTPDVAVGQCQHLLIDGGTQRAVTYDVEWPDDAPTLHVGETLLKPKRGLPAITTQAAADVVFETTQTAAAEPTNEPTKLVRLIDPLTPREVSLEDVRAGFTSLPTDIVAERVGGRLRITGGLNGTKKLSPGLVGRVLYDPDANLLSIKGVFDDSNLGEPLLLLNVLTPRERDELKMLSTDASWGTLIDTLFDTSRNPNAVDADGNMTPDKKLLLGFTMRGKDVVPEHLLGDKALTAGLAEGTGYVTLAFNNDRTLSPLPVSLNVLKVDCGVYQGQVHVLPAGNVFDEAVTLQHSGDFAGDPSALLFDWYYALKEKDCRRIDVPPSSGTVGSPWLSLGSGMGLSNITLSGPGVTSLADTCVMARYRGYGLCPDTETPSQWAGEAFRDSSPTDPHPQLVEGWLARVTAGLNPFDQRTSDFRNNGVNTIANAVAAAGRRPEGPVAFNPDASALNSVGLIEVYDTVLGRGEDLSIRTGLSVDAVNGKLLDVAARISDLYMLLGNEAYQDALDPTIGFTTSSTQFGTAASSKFAFQDQMDSLLSEELALLRGRDDMVQPQVYNRLIWNFTGRDGQVAYQQNYRITDQNSDGRIDEKDAAILFPQGHGDAWGHYLTALTEYYKLLREPNFTWLPRADSVSVAGTEVLVDFTDERRFAAAAAARARTGAQIVDLTYRQRWVDDPAGQWQGYKDTDGDRAFGVSEWAARAGQGAYFDWVVANAILPPHSDAPPGIGKIDRTTVPELSEIAAQSGAVQSALDLVDRGMNPLGLAKNVVPFDVDPNFLQVGSSVQGKQHYEQIADRAGEALANAVRVFDYANGLTQLLRQNQDTADQFGRNVAAQERDYNNRLIEIFGTPYGDDIGPGRTYPTGYEGPDLVNWSLADPSELTGQYPEILRGGATSYDLSVPVPQWASCAGSQEGTCRYDPNNKLTFAADGSLLTTDSTVTVTLSNSGFGRLKPSGWTKPRKSPGELQLARSDLLQTFAQFQRAKASYEALITDILCVYSTIVGQNRLAADRLTILNTAKKTSQSFNDRIFGAKIAEVALNRAASVVRDMFEVVDKAAGQILIGVVGDASGTLKGPAKLASNIAANVLEAGADAAETSQLRLEQDADQAAQQSAIQIQGLEDDFESFNLLGALSEKMVQEPVLKLEALTLAEQMRQSAARLQGVLARGDRLLDELVAFRKKTATQVAASRYDDMAFRVFRNDALQKYRAQFDLASRYVYLTAAAYDYETNLQGTAQRAGRKFLTDVVRQRSLGQFVGGNPVAGSPGLGDTMAQMSANFSVLKGQFGFNNPQTETNRFSLRRELFRVLDTSNAQWRAVLAEHRVPDLWKVDAFRRFARPPGSESDGPLPGIVIPIPTTVTFGFNFFHFPLAGGDSAYDPTNFATKVRTMGVWFGNYDAKGLSNTPRVYLIPVGEDVLRSPAAGDFRVRAWSILDQRVPVPFAIGSTDTSDLLWTPNKSLSDPLGEIRRHSSFRAYHDMGSIMSGQVTTESRAIARSVWNTRWVLMIAGGALLSDADEGLNTFIYGKPVPGGGSVTDPNGVARDGNGISDILIFFQTYALSGN